MVNTVFTLNYTLKPAKWGAVSLIKERSFNPLLVTIHSTKLQDHEAGLGCPI